MPAILLRFLAIALFFFLPLLGHAQVPRFDIPVFTINQSAPQPGAMYPVLAFPNAKVQICATWNPSVAACTTLATTYMSGAGGGTCPSTAQLVSAQPGSGCSGFSDSAGGVGGFAAAGTYAYVFTAPYGTFGPYVFQVGGSGGGGSPAVPIGATQYYGPTGSFSGASPINELAQPGSTLASRVLTACNGLGTNGGVVVIPFGETSTDTGFVSLPLGCVIEDHRGIILTGGNGFTLLSNGATGGITHNAIWNGSSVNLFYPYIVDAVTAWGQSGGLNNYDGSTGVKSNFELRSTTGNFATPGQHAAQGMVLSNNSPGDVYTVGSQLYDTGWATASGDEGAEISSQYIFAGMPALTATVASVTSSTALTLTCGSNCTQLGEQQPIVNTSRGVQNTGTATINTAIPPVVTITGGTVTCPGGTNPCSSSTQNGVGLFFEFTSETYSGHHIVMPVIAVNSAGTQLTLLIQHRQTAPTTPTNTQWEGNTTSGAYAVYQGSTITAVPYTAAVFTSLQATLVSTSMFQANDSIMVPGGNNRNMNGFNLLLNQNVPAPSNGGSCGLCVTSSGHYPIVYGSVATGSFRQAAFGASWIGYSLPNFGVQLQGPSPGVGYFQGADFATLTSTENMLCAGTHTSGANKCLAFYRTAGLFQDHFQLPDGTFAKGVDITDSMQMLGNFTSVGTIANNAGGFGTIGNAALCSYFAASCISNWVTPSGGFALASATANSATDLYGATTVQKGVTDSSASGTHAEGQQQAVTISLTATTNYVFSIYAMTDGVAPAAQINISFFGGGTWGPTCLPSQFSATYNLTTTLTRYSITCAVTSSTTTLDPAWVTYTPSANAYTWCAQLEVGTVPGPCLQTIATAIPEQIAQALKGLIVSTGGVGVTDGVGTTTAGVIPESTSAAHVLDYNSSLSIASNTLSYTGSGGIKAPAFTSTTGAILFSALPTCNVASGPIMRSVSDVSGAGSLTWGATVSSGTGTATTPITVLFCDEVHWTVMAQ